PAAPEPNTLSLHDALRSLAERPLPKAQNVTFGDEPMRTHLRRPRRAVLTAAVAITALALAAGCGSSKSSGSGGTAAPAGSADDGDRKSTRLTSSHLGTSY